MKDDERFTLLLLCWVMAVAVALGILGVVTSRPRQASAATPAACEGRTRP